MQKCFKEKYYPLNKAWNVEMCFKSTIRVYISAQKKQTYNT